MIVKYEQGLQRIPIKRWLEDVEDSAWQQALNLSNLPFTFSHIALMPDCHSGYGMPIGGVMATKGVIVPNAVGVDVGCGMCAVKTPWKIEEIDKVVLKKIMGIIRKVIPVGFNKHKEPQNKKYMPDPFCSLVVEKEYDNALCSLGTLGGGNHFLEIQKDTEGFVWIMIHSGSRNLGKKVAEYYNKLAIILNEKYHSSVPTNFQLAFLPMDTNIGMDYEMDMNFCVEFALKNRMLMIERIAETFDKVMSSNKIDLSQVINIAHNYARMEHHFGENVMVHRKGATSARKDEIGIIPGSQGSKSYIVKGLGNVQSFTSCSHGAGRKMSRKSASENLNLEEEIKKLDDQGIIHSIRHKNDLDEADGAYKDIKTVMENQSDLVEIVTELSPLAVVKG